MKTKKYRITIKMIKIIIMDHEQVSMEKAKKDIERLIENSSDDSINKIFIDKPIYKYKVSKII